MPQASSKTSFLGEDGPCHELPCALSRAETGLAAAAGLRTASVLHLCLLSVEQLRSVSCSHGQATARHQESLLMLKTHRCCAVGVFAITRS